MSIESATQAPARSSSSRPRLIPAVEFDPSPELAEKLLSRLADPDYSLGSLAEIANTSLESFTLWLTKPDIAARIANIESVMATKVRLDVACYVPLIIHSCKTTLAFYSESLNHRHISDHDNRGHSIRARQGHTAMMASRILLHLAKHYAKPAQPPRAPRQDPAPSSGPTPAPALTPTPSSSSSSSRFTTLPPLPDLTNLHDQRAANHTTSPNPTRDNSTEPAFTSPSRERRSDASSSAHEMGARSLPDAPASGTPTPAPSQAHEMGDRSACTPTTTPLTETPATLGKSPCACHSKSRKTKSCTSCTSTPTPLLISAGTATPRPRETPKPSH